MAMITSPTTVIETKTHVTTTGREDYLGDSSINN